ncbi:hypothetical protein KUH03_31765 [Sphingobacterium sp. E70]|uniref:hypothetical protein n=1 Tax=Sphingobacterium sp. E70 TaxID=2853439 RepID=UPI00211BDAD9|nr:hypothetical protein [Sphingobacterium sp. E70]ULT23697.1 hypothetical protein KUH03_31765 [Sphingobacterium sp. E70]
MKNFCESSIDTRVADETDRIIVRTATAADLKYAMEISAETASSAKARGTGIGTRTPQSICNKILEGNAVIALTQTGNGLAIFIWKPMPRRNLFRIAVLSFRHPGDVRVSQHL